MCTSRIQPDLHHDSGPTLLFGSAIYSVVISQTMANPEDLVGYSEARCGTEYKKHPLLQWI